MNTISAKGLELFSRERYEVACDLPNPDAILVRSGDLHGLSLPSSLKAIARAGAGYNNIPVKECSTQGIVVFNTPGANANAVKELVLASLLLSSRGISDGIQWALSIANQADQVPDIVEKEKTRFAGPEIKGKTLGIVGLGAIGVMVANDAIALGMNVIGYDPYISVEAAWNLSRQVIRADSLEGLLSKADYTTLHVPLSAHTKGFFDAEKLRLMKRGARLLNFARGGLVNEGELIEALNTNLLSCYVTDFPSAELLGCPKVICIPHLGASTPEAEENCALMAVQQLIGFLEEGSIRNSVNFPVCRLDRNGAFRIVIINRNIPNMVGQITTILASAGINIVNMINQSRDEYAYNIIDTEQKIPESSMRFLRAVDGIIRIRLLE
jgi:D-3-phosphoglycerate dehydrogenase